MTRTAAAVLAGLLLGAGLTACGDQGSATSAGQVVLGHLGDDVEGDSAYVLVPTGRIDLTVGEPVDEISAEESGDAEAHAAPDGGALVPVGWSHDPFGEGAVPVGVLGADPQETDVVLVSGDSRADLGSPYRLAGEQGTTDTGVGTMYVAVDGDGTTPSFEVTYDGLTQTVEPATGDRDAGAATPLYDDPTIGVEAPCTSEGFASPAAVPDVACVVNAPQPTPYLPGHGWAAEGRTWLLVSADLSVSGVRVGSAQYDVTSLTPDLAVDGEAPLPADERYGRAEPQPSAVRGTWAFDAASGGGNSLTVALDLVLEKTSGDGPSTRQVRVEQEVALGAG